MGRTNAKKRGRELRRIRIAVQVAKELHVERDNDVLFPAVAAALGREWRVGVDRRKKGYALIEEYAAAHNVVFKRSEGRRRSKSVGVAADEFLLSYEWRRLRMEVIKARGPRCECCGATPSDGVTVINVDHIRPRKLFPELALEKANLQVLCGACNHGKGNWDQTDWRETDPSTETVQ